MLKMIGHIFMPLDSAIAKYRLAESNAACNGSNEYNIRTRTDCFDAASFLEKQWLVTSDDSPAYPTGCCLSNVVSWNPYQSTKKHTKESQAICKVLGNILISFS